MISVILLQQKFVLVSTLTPDNVAILSTYVLLPYTTKINVTEFLIIPLTMEF